MEKTVLYQFLTEVPQAAAIWSGLLVLAMTVLTVLVARPERDRPEDDPGGDPTRPSERDLAAAEAADLRRYAEEVAVAATRAAETARRRRAEWVAAHTDLERAWAAYDAAETAARRFAGAGALPTPRTPRTPAEYAARERYLHRAATAAHWRGDLTLAQLGDVFGHRNGWDPRRHPVEQEVRLARFVRDERLADYRAAGERERSAWRDAELAAEAARALAAEAYAAAARLRTARVPAARAVTTATARPATARWRPARAG
ncbi:hypothetical protein [Micromonospora globbae]|uniref:AP2/ERF domain-containing protein n=2 Tax=Micromonospora globbae TaxID=1894969 RepID=A0A420F1Y1_9ACTN|nr:hypothetical protein [Micromonospora globbae]RKF27006.1 hypothetical protein D7I43_13805 [Micromonospora globbae]WTF88224.1 hypothetical protein OH732_11905 [Micromonospora globbae]